MISGGQRQIRRTRHSCVRQCKDHRHWSQCFSTFTKSRHHPGLPESSSGGQGLNRARWRLPPPWSSSGSGPGLLPSLPNFLYETPAERTAKTAWRGHGQRVKTSPEIRNAARRDTLNINTQKLLLSWSPIEAAWPRERKVQPKGGGSGSDISWTLRDFKGSIIRKYVSSDWAATWPAQSPAAPPALMLDNPTV